ncbi:cupin domain-containing protein [Caballeronia sp. LP006]|uniref:cupin domain-containing protein n=1 Tax=Caballeronia sp. LP006 TaxID=3038552 RepID=UPI0028655C95|nr:cupin domain-containing protein [Caballeronia sp. LP006]MDR5832324.1 cupin domain-containing protein [Caballeronia sp. LP006]
MQRLQRLAVLCSSVVAISYSLASSNPALSQTMQSNQSENKPANQSVPAVEILPSNTTTTLKNPGKDSVQLLWYKNSPEAKMTITRVTMQPKAVSERHSHAISEQEWIVEKGQGTLLLANNATREIRAGDVVRTPAGAIHGVVNSGNETLIYISVTTPPEDFSKFYSDRGSAK